MKPELIARVAHEVNRAYCAALGDDSQVGWDDAPEWQQQSALAGVQMHLANPDATPEQSHESWLAAKLADGWAYGEVKDAEKKQHPCCVPYDELPLEQKVKDYLFRAVVHSLKDIPDANPEELAALQAKLEQALAARPAAAPVSVSVSGAGKLPGTVPVKYIGRRAEWRDRLYGTGLYFAQGQIRYVPAPVAERLLKHIDLFARAEEGELAAQPAPAPEQPADEQLVDDTEKLLAEAAARQKEQNNKEFELADLHREVDNMDFATLQEFASSRYGLKLTKQKGLEKGRAEVHARIDQFGAV